MKLLAGRMTFEVIESPSGSTAVEIGSSNDPEVPVSIENIGRGSGNMGGWLEMMLSFGMILTLTGSTDLRAGNCQASFISARR